MVLKLFEKLKQGVYRKLTKIELREKIELI